MRRAISTFLLALFVFFSMPTANAQGIKKEFSIETEPMAYILGGVGMTGSYQYGSWTYSIEAFGELTIPELLHGNQGFEARLVGIEVQIERFLNGTDGFFLGPEIGISKLEVVHKSSDEEKAHTGYSVGLRGGYHWETGLENLYVSPVAGVGYSLNAEDIKIQNQTFESGDFTPWATIGIGWSFSN